MEKIKIYAHRCAALDGHGENTLEAAEAALLNGADGFEIDARLTSDGEVVVFHDENLARLFPGFKMKTKNGEETNKIRKLRLKDLRRIDLPNGGKISTLFQFLKLAEEKNARIFIEIKESSPELLRRVAGEIKVRPAVDAIVISFKANDLRAIKEINPAIKTGLIIGSLRQIIRFKKLFSLWEISGVYDYLFFGWDPEEPSTKWEFKIALWYLWLRRILPLPTALRQMVFTGIVKNEKELEYLQKWGFTSIFSDTMKL